MKNTDVLWRIAVLLAAAFVVKTGFDYHTYTTTLSSAPFYLWIGSNAVKFLLPAAVVAVIAWVKGKK